MPEDKKTQEQIPAWAQQLMEENKALTKKVEMFEDMAGKNTIASYENAQKTYETKFAKFKIHNDKIVVGWSDLDMSEFRPGARTSLEENILVTLFYLDGTKAEKENYIAFDRLKDYIKFEVLEIGSEITKIKFTKDIIDEYKLESDRADIPTKFLNR